MTEKMSLTWLDSLREGLDRSLAEDRLGHAVLLTGPRGVGKRVLANWLCARYLLPRESHRPPGWPPEEFAHPDAAFLSPPEGKDRISIEQVRQLVADIGLTSHAGRGKAAVIEPAQAMTANAANSLLKTLEEPPGDALLILVADTLSGMPATILSRCAVLRVPLPPAALALRWLEEGVDAGDWEEALALAGGAPLQALAHVESGAAERPRQFREELGQVIDGRLGPLDAAARWSKQDARLALEWLEKVVTGLIRRRIAGSRFGAASPVPESVLQRMDSQNMFCYLDRLTRLRNQPRGTYNEQVALESLLIPWAEGLQDNTADLESAPLGLHRRS